MERRRRLTLAQARRMALGAQGFARPRPSGRIDVRHFRRAVSDMALVQLDSVNVFQRSHRMPFFARLGPYDVDALDAWLWRSGEMVEAWCHVASVVPMEQWPHMGWRRRADRERRAGIDLHTSRPGLLDAVHAFVRENGPTTVSELPMRGERNGPEGGEMNDPAATRGGTTRAAGSVVWGNPPGKRALQWLGFGGELAVHDRIGNFVTSYDIAERVVPDTHRHDDLPAVHAVRAQLLLAARSHGVGTDKDLADVHRLGVSVVRPVLSQLVAVGELVEVDVEGWSEVAYAHPDAVLPRSVDARALLTPFDPVVWFRPRDERLFDFHYRIEIYTPEAKREYGYYVLPFLLGDELVGRVDLRHDRRRNVLEVPGAFAEDGQDRVRVARELAAELRVAAAWVGADDIEVGDRGDVVTGLRAELA